MSVFLYKFALLCGEKIMDGHANLCFDRLDGGLAAFGLLEISSVLLGTLMKLEELKPS